jgi:transcription antitermination factor NusG
MDDTSRWFALQVKPRYEKMTSQLLRYKGYEDFLPVYSVTRKRSDRMQRIELPLFPGYVFCRCAWQPGLRSVNTPGIVTTPGVIRIVGPGKSAAPVEDAEIEHVRFLVRSGMGAEPCSYFESGQNVRLTGGPLRGVEGKVMHSNGRAQLVVSVTLLQRSVAVTIDPAWIAKVEPPCRSL